MSDALCSSETLSQASEILEDSEGVENNVLKEIVPEKNFSTKDKDNVKKLNLGEGDDGHSLGLTCENSSSDTFTNYEDALDKLNHGDSVSQSSTVVFYYMDEDSDASNVNCSGDLDDSPNKLYKKNKESDVSSKTNFTKSYIQKFKASQESFKEKSPEFSGYYDRISGCSPCNLPQADYPPFQGLLTSTLQCSECGHHSSLRYDTFDSVSLPLGDNFPFPVQKLQDLLQKFVKTEVISDVDCEKCCKKTTAFKTLNFGKVNLLFFYIHH